MSGWRLSWRATGAWLAASLIAALFFGAVISAMNVWADPTDAGMFLSTAILAAAVAGAGLLAGGGVLLLISVAIARARRLPRPWLECAVLAAACSAITNSGGLVQFSLETPSGELQPGDHPAAFIVAHLAPALTGVLMGWVYWVIASRHPSRHVI